MFAGRLSPEKGVETLLEAWSLHQEPVRLLVAGDGDLAPAVQAAAAADPRIEFLGWQERERISELVADAACVVIPSLWYEGFVRTIVEAYARGTPVLASHLGAMAELIDDGVTGHRFSPGDPQELADAFCEAWRSGGWKAMRPTARQRFLDRYTADANYRILMSIYLSLIHI